MASRVFIRSKDRKAFKKSEVDSESKNRLVEYRGPRFAAMKARVPLFDKRGNLVQGPFAPFLQIGGSLYLMRGTFTTPAKANAEAAQWKRGKAVRKGVRVIHRRGFWTVYTLSGVER